jgi:hypothetical protein
MVLKLLEDRPEKMMAKDTTPTDGRTVLYQVLARTFVNGALAEPSSDGSEVFVMSVPGLHGGPLKQVNPPLEVAAHSKMVAEPLPLTEIENVSAKPSKK